MNDAIRYTKAECTDQQRIELFLRQARSGNIGFYDGEYPYVIPMAYVWYQGAFYFHGSAEGKKNRVITAHPKICFTIYEDYGAMIAPVPAGLNTAHMSVIAYGSIEEVSDFEHATEALNAMIKKYVPNYYEKPMKQDFLEKYRSSMGSRTVTWRMVPEDLKAKENPYDPSKMFFGGRTRQTEVELGIK